MVELLAKLEGAYLWLNVNDYFYFKKSENRPQCEQQI